jgi:hypothetical protein
MTLNEFFLKYQPIRNSVEKDRPYENRLFETFGKEQDTVYQTDPAFVWTIVTTDDDDSEVIVPGRRFVNRVGYFITTVEFTGLYLEIPIYEE